MNDFIIIQCLNEGEPPCQSAYQLLRIYKLLSIPDRTKILALAYKLRIQSTNQTNKQ